MRRRDGVLPSRRSPATAPLPPADTAGVTACNALAAAILLLLAVASSAQAGGTDLRPGREAPRDTAKARAQEAQKQKLLAKMRADAPSRIERVPNADALQLPLFADRQVP